MDFQPVIEHQIADQFQRSGLERSENLRHGVGNLPFTEQTNADEILMKVYTAKAAAAMMQICTETLRRLVREGAQHRRVGRRILFTEADIAAMLESKLMTGAVNPYARKPKQQQTNLEHTNEQQPSNQPDGGSTVAADATATADAAA